MSRPERERLLDILAACEAITSYIDREASGDDMRFDAIRARLIEIGEAAKDLSPALRASEPDVPWAEIAKMRDHLAHRYFDTAHAIVRATARNDVPVLAEAVMRMLGKDDG
ncbi:MAG: HepT-like ribonuclease domain-containing protein [Rhodoglobus sp.]